MSREGRKRWFKGLVDAMNSEGWKVDKDDDLKCPIHATDDDRDLEETDLAKDFNSGYSEVCIDCGNVGCDCHRKFKVRE